VNRQAFTTLEYQHLLELVKRNAQTEAGERRVETLTPIDDAATYRVTTNDFLANGGDSFPGFTVGTNRVYAPGFDVDALAAYLAAGPIAPGPQNRITRVP